jgi:hypothetical protein
MKIGFTKTVLLSVLAFAAIAFVLPASASALSSDTLVALTNQERAAAGLSPLHINSNLMVSAQAKAQDMIARDYWAHFAPDGTSPWFFITQSGYKYVGAGENLAMDFASDQDVMTGWMNSPTHRANILNPSYVDVGISVVEGYLQGHDTMLVVAHYGIPAQAPAPAPVAAAPAPTEPVTAVPAEAAPVTDATPVVLAASKVVKHNANSKSKAAPNRDNSVLTLLKLGLAQMWLAPFLKYRGIA